MNTQINLDTKLKLYNATTDDSEMNVFGDCGRYDYVGLKFTYKDKLVKLGDKKEEDSEYFHLKKDQVGFLIDFLKRLYDGMQSEEHK